ncbi:MAG: hypothetical protein KKA05_06165 [Alphaproteobacteria bacterium]|nr:hypothetical protein [Alphaproteobacteria bacterium]MBU0858381.1 hypothetical protein [Alphaproteobacteria bacterium]
MGDVVAFKKPLSLPQSAPPTAQCLAAEFYHQCQVQALTEGINAKRANPALKLSQLVPSLTRIFTEDLIAQKLLEASTERNLSKLHIAEELQTLLETPHTRAPALARA